MSRSLLIKVACGAEDAERTNQAFNVAAAAVAMGADVSLWLAGEAAWFGTHGGTDSFHLDLATPLGDLLDSVREGGRVTVCSQCAARRGITTDHLLDGVTIAGAAVFAEHALSDGVQALVY